MGVHQRKVVQELYQELRVEPCRMDVEQRYVFVVSIGTEFIEDSD